MEHEEFLKLLDSYIDDELNEKDKEAFIAHAAQCPECAKELHVAEMIRDALSEMDDNIRIPLQAEASWKRAIKAESKNRKARKLYRIVAGVAAAFVLVFGVSFAMNKKVARIEPALTETNEEFAAGEEAAEAVSEQTVLSDGVKAGSSSGKYDAERKYVCADASEAAGTIKETAAEYGAVVKENGNELIITIAGENASDFLNAISRIGDETVNTTGDLSGESVSICITITQQ